MPIDHHHDRPHAKPTPWETMLDSGRCDTTPSDPRDSRGRRAFPVGRARVRPGPAAGVSAGTSPPSPSPAGRRPPRHPRGVPADPRDRPGRRGARRGSSPRRGSTTTAPSSTSARPRRCGRLIDASRELEAIFERQVAEEVPGDAGTGRPPGRRSTRRGSVPALEYFDVMTGPVGPAEGRRALRRDAAEAPGRRLLPRRHDEGGVRERGSRRTRRTRRRSRGSSR